MQKEKFQILSDKYALSDIKIPQELYQLSDNYTKKQIAAFQRDYGGIENYLRVLYHLWFIEKLQKSEIAQKIGVDSTAIHGQLYNLMLGESQDWETSLQERETLIKNGSELREAGKQLNLDDIPELKEIVMNANRYTNRTKFSQFSSEDEYLKVLAYYYLIKRMSPIEMIPVMREVLGTIQQRLRRFNLNLPFDVGIKGKMERGSQNYVLSFARKKLVTIKSQEENSNLATANQNRARNMLTALVYMPDFFNRHEYIVIIGCDNTGILDAKEIDIPIVIQRRDNRQTYIFAMEYNGPYHTKEQDEIKRKLAEKNGLIYEPLYEIGSAISNSDNKLQLALRAVLTRIMANVKLQEESR